MKKLKLNLDRLQVESFAPAAEPAAPRGTVRGMEPWSEEDTCRYTCGYSCRTCYDPSCGNTCRGGTCDYWVCIPV
jgi:hypothetical protein